MKNELDISKKILHNTISKLSKQPNFPDNYCNIASKILLETLTNCGKDVRLQFSYLEPWSGHTYLIERLSNWEEFIIDPTYAQYEEEYIQWFIWQHFNDEILEQNRTEKDIFMKLQKKWFEEGLYG